MIEIRAFPVPNGCVANTMGRRVRVALAISFSCSDSSFKDLPDALKDWPQTLRGRSVLFDVGLKDAAGARIGTAFQAQLSQLDSALWSKLIVLGRRWQSHSTEADTGALRSYSVRKLVDILSSQRVLDALACTALDTPSGNESVREAAEKIHKIREELHVPPEVGAFHGIGPESRRQARRLFANLPENANEIEQLLATFQKAPELSRRLGIVLHFESDSSISIPAQGFVHCDIKIDAAVRDLAVAEEQPSIAVAFECDLTESLFLPRPRSMGGTQSADSRIASRSGLFVMRANSADADPFFVTPADYVGGAFKEAEFSPKNQAPGLSLIDAHDGAPAADKSVGISLNENDAAGLYTREQTLAKQRVDRAAQQHASHQPITLDPLFAEDLLIGVRPDVRRSNGSGFRSLCEVHNEYFALGGNVPIASEDCEAFVERCFTRDLSSENGNTYISDQSNLHEALVHWNGWSVAVPRPGKVVNDVQAPEVDGLGFFRKNATARAKSLERLRFASSYEFRMRPVFIGGTGPSGLDVGLFQASTNDRLRSQSVHFTRAEPVGSPVVICKDDFAPGESLLGVTVRNRSWHDHSSSTRYILPPAAPIEVAEYCGEFDQESDAWYRTLVEQLGPGSGSNTAAGYLPDPWADRVLVEVRIITRCGSRLNPKGRTKNETSPDLCTDGVAKFEVLFRDAQSRWPKIRAFRVRCKAISTGPSWFVRPPSVASSGYLFELNLAPGDQFELLLRTLAPKPNRDQFHISQRISQSMSDGHPMMGTLLNDHSTRSLVDATRSAIADGVHAMVAPSLKLTATYVTPAPEIAPSFGEPRFHRDPSGTAAVLSDTVIVDGATSASVRVEAKWNDLVDDETQAKPRASSGQTASHSVPVDRAASAVRLRDPADPKKGLPNSIQLQFPDTHARQCTLQAVAASRFVEHFPEDGSSKVKREMRSKSLDLVLPASSPPAPIEVAFCVPIDTWKRTYSSAGFNSQRSSRSVRMYLRRKWWWGESLGIVCWPNATSSLSQKQLNQLAKYVTEWGNEPLVVTQKKLSEGPYAMHFPAATAHVDGILPILDDAGSKINVLGLKLSDLRVSVASHEVQYDEERQLWFADVIVDLPDTYLPWIKFSLVRFQPHALSDCHLSVPVVTQYAQLSPDRVLTLARVVSDPGLVAVSLSGAFADAGVSFNCRVNARLLKAVDPRAPTLVQQVGPVVEFEPNGIVEGVGMFSKTLRVEKNWQNLQLEVREEFAENPIGSAATLSKPVFIEHVYLDQLFS
jgi:hypothetical protein